MEEGSDIYKASSSLRVGSASIWRGGASKDAFSRSSRDEDDEEALLWDAIERLPTYDRLNKGILTASHGVVNEIDIDNIGIEERKKLLARLLNVAEQDNEKFLLKLRNRIVRSCHECMTFHIYIGALFFTVSIIMFNGMAELSMTIAKLPIFFKQRGLLFDPAWSYVIPSWILKIPISFAEVAVWVFMTYYVIGFDPNVGRLFKQYFLLVVVNQMASALFQAIAGLSRNMIVASTFGSFSLLLIFALGGFVLSKDDVKKWWVWGYWVSPLMYGQNAIVVNEFLGHSWSKVVAGSNETLGRAGY